MCANETAMHQPKAVRYLAAVYIKYHFESSFVSLSRIKIPSVFSEVAITIRTHLCSLPRLTFSFSAETYWNLSPMLDFSMYYYKSSE